MTKNPKLEQIQIHSKIYCEIEVRSDKLNFHQRYSFSAIYSSDSLICMDWAEAVEFSEIFSAFTKNALSRETKYFIGSIFFYFEASDAAPALHMTIPEGAVTAEKRFCFSKLECLQIYSKLSKILSKCDLMAHGGY